MLSLYRENPVPLYLRLPPPPDARIKAVRDGEGLYCFLSYVAKRRSRHKTIVYVGEDDPGDYSVRNALNVVMLQARSPDAGAAAAEALRAAGARLNPYRSGRCLGFYARSFDDLFRLLETVADYVRAAAIVHTVWYLYYRSRVNLRVLARAGFIVSLARSTFRVAMGSVNNTTVRIFQTGTVGVYGVHTPETIHVFARQLWGYMRSIGAVR